MFNKLSLKYRIALVIFILEACMLSAVLWFTFNESVKSAKDQHAQTQNVILDLVSELTTSALLTEEYGDLQFYVESLARDPTIKQIILTETNDIVVVSNMIQNIGAPMPAIHNSEISFWRSKKVDSPAGLLGQIFIQFSTESIIAANTRTRNLGISIATIGMSIILVIGITVGYALTRRLDKVTRAAAQFAEGDIQVQSGVTGSDELGALGQTFDKMVNAVASQQKQLQQQILRNKTILATAQDGFFISDRNGVIRQVNQAFCRFAGTLEASLINCNVSTIFPITNPQEFINRIQQLTHNRYDQFEIHFTGLNKSTTYFDINLSYVELDDEQFIFGFLRDITQRKLAEQALREHKENLEKMIQERTIELSEKAQIIDQIHDSVVSTDLSGLIQSWNKGAERIFGYTEQEALGKHLSILYPKDFAKELNNQIISPLLEKGEHNIEIQMLRKNGENFYGRLSLSLQRDQNGQISRLIGYTLDISKRKKAEDALEKRSKELEIANKELESFSYSVSHDLRAPLRSINGFCGILMEDYADKLDADAKGYLLRITNASVRMGKLIDDLLNLSRISRQAVKKDSIDLSVIASSILKNLQESNPKRNVSVKISDKMPAKADKDLMMIALQNLLDNAWKYTSKLTNAQIEMGTTIQNHQEVFYVRDNGAGFDMKYADKLFGAFQRLHKSDFEGTGIGLATVARIIHRHGGQIWATAEVDRGATFYFTLK